jgi:hypothetical protein
MTDYSLDFDEIQMAMESEFMGHESTTDVMGAGNGLSMEMDYENDSGTCMQD